MSGFIPITLESREGLGKECSSKLRANGFIPAVFYGPDYPEARHFTIDAKKFLPHLRTSHWETLRFDVTLPDGKEEMALVRDLQRNPISDEVLHIDLYQLVKGHKVRVAVPVRVVGKDACVGVKAGGIFELVHHVLEMEVQPREIPDEIVLDVSKLAKGQSIHVKDCKLPEGAELLVDEEAIVVMIAHPRGEEEAPVLPEAGASAMEVEVVKKGKKEEE